MNIAEIAKRAAVRRVVGVLVVIALGLLGIGRAEAACAGGNGTQCDTPEEASAACESWAAAYVPPSHWNEARYVECSHHPEPKYFRAHRDDTPGTAMRTFYYVACPPGTEWNEETKKCGQPCSQQPPLGASTITGGGFETCKDGCMYEPSAPVSVSFGQGAGAFTLSDSWAPTGATCSVGDAPAPSDKPQECVEVEGQSMCVKPNGQHCYSASTGRQICWTPGETGEKTDGPIKQKRSPGETPISPAPLTNGDGLTPQGPPMHASTTNGATGHTSITNVVNYGTNSGADAGGGHSGEGGDGSGSGGGGGGWYGGGGGGSGNGDGGGDGDEGDDGAGEAGAGVGTLYEGHGKTVESVIGDFHTRMMASPLIGAATGFFAVQGGGSCPTFNFSMFGQTTNIEFFCLPEFQQVFYWLGWFVLAMFTWKAFEVGFG